MRLRSARPLPLLLVLALSACGGGGGDPMTASPAQLDAGLQSVIATQALDGDPADGQVAVKPADNALVKLGQILFFSKTLGGTFDSACATCHHPDLAGGDLLSLPVGVSAVNPDYLGPGRKVDAARDYDPLKDGGPNVPRNSQTVLNVGLYRQAMFFDGRVSLLPPPAASGDINTPESGQGADPAAGPSLLNAQARFPVTSGDEMRNFFHPELGDPEAFRQRLVDRLRGTADQDRMGSGAAANWLALFRTAFGQPTADANTLITYANMQAAIAAYERGLVFTDSPWKQYVQGNSDAIGTDAKRGALLFFRAGTEGGLGCAACHAGDFFTDEHFYNVGFPQIGRGKRVDGRDFGRWQVTKQDADKFAFRVPNLTNVALGAPYGHAGTFQSLDDLLRYHANPVAGAASFDYSLSHLLQFQDGSKTYANAKTYTLEAVNAPNLALDKLPGRALSDAEVRYLKAFLNSLTDPCVQNAPTCLAPWTPAAGEDPDGNLLVRDFNPVPATPVPVTPPPVPYPEPNVTLQSLGIAPRTAFREISNCAGLPNNPLNDGAFFVERGLAAGLTVPHEYADTYWLDGPAGQLQIIMMGGGVTATDLNADCLPDLAFTTGDNPGVMTYLNQGMSLFQSASLMGADTSGLFTSIGAVDLNGDYRRELVLGNLLSGYVKILKQDDSDVLQLSGKLAMSRSSLSLAVGDVTGDGYPDLYFGHWDYRTLPGIAPAFWKNTTGGTHLVASDGPMGTSTAAANATVWQLTPTFADMDQDGWNDLLIAADFGSSKVYRNVDNGGSRLFKDVTNRDVVTDENGMGSAVGDYDNDGDLDWFVTSIFDPNGVAEGHWGTTGNRLYRNDSVPGTIKLADVTSTANVRDGLWGWGACFADFNNDGWLDLFQVDGYSYIPYAGRTPEQAETLNYMAAISAEFVTKPSRLFINNHNGSFTESATAWQVDLPMDGRGIVCSDMDRDGDIDIVALDHSRRLKFFENRLGHDTGHGFVSIRLQGRAPNTDALGAKVYVSADLNNDGMIGTGERQLRVANANSNFNSQNTPDLHFGTGSATKVSLLRIVWPDGQEQVFLNQPIDQFYVFSQP